MSQYVPGVMHCAKCNFRLVRTKLNVSQGTTSAGDNETEPCPNGCGPLWPVTWEQEARECWKLLERDTARVQNLMELFEESPDLISHRNLSDEMYVAINNALNYVARNKLMLVDDRAEDAGSV